MFCPQSKASDTEEREILDLSLQKLKWKTNGDFERLASLFDDELVFVHITGNVTTKAEWISALRSGAFVYEKILVRDAAAKVYGDAAVVVGRAIFTVNGGAVYKLVYTEVYAKKTGQWRLVNLHTTSGNF